jgi:WD40 repeat protein
MEKLSKNWATSCNSVECRDALEYAINSGCFGSRGCKSSIDNYYLSCSVCADDILDPNTQVIVNGNSFLFCVNDDNLQLKACLFYCRVYYLPNGNCLVQKIGASICECNREVTSATSSTMSTTTMTSQTTIATTTISSFGSVLFTFIGHSSSLKGLASLKTGDLASGSSDGSIKIWNKNDGTLKRTPVGHNSYVFVLTTLLNDDLASGSNDKTIKIWNVNDGSLKRTLAGHTGDIYALKILQNWDIASGSSDNMIKIWNPNDGTLKRTLIGHTFYIYGLTTLQDGDITSCSVDRSIKI